LGYCTPGAQYNAAISTDIQTRRQRKGNESGLCRADILLRRDRQRWRRARGACGLSPKPRRQRKVWTAADDSRLSASRGRPGGMVGTLQPRQPLGPSPSDQHVEDHRTGSSHHAGALHAEESTESRHADVLLCRQAGALAPTRYIARCTGSLGPSLQAPPQGVGLPRRPAHPQITSSVLSQYKTNTSVHRGG
jgi:hypothetical protein